MTGARAAVVWGFVVAALGTGVAAVGSALGLELGDVVLDRRSTANQVEPVVFPHWKHRLRFKCYACHPEPFAMEAGATDISMDALGAGRLCGSCHDGRTAFEIGFQTCRNCHVGPQG